MKLGNQLRTLISKEGFGETAQLVPQIIWTRESPLEGTLHIPCVQHRIFRPEDVTHPKIPPTTFAFTSPRAVALTWEHPVLGPWLRESKQIYCFGPSTYLALQKLLLTGECMRLEAESGKGFAEKLIARRGLGKLRSWFPNKEKIYLPGPLHRAFDLAKALEKAGIPAININLYETISKVPLDTTPLDPTQSYHLCIGSPSAARGFWSWLPKEFPLSHIHVLCLGETTREACPSGVKSTLVEPQTWEALTKAAFSFCA